MARLKGFTTGIALLILVSGAAGINFDVKITDITSYTAVDFNYTEKPDPVQTVNVTVENTGSIGCRFRLKGEFNRSGKIVERWSPGYGLWPGESRLMSLKYVPVNYTGRVDSTLELHYCGESVELENFSYNHTQRMVSNQTVENQVRNVNSSSAEIRLDAENGVLLPEESPPGWKTPSARIENGKAVIRYEPTLFHRDREITYSVLQDGQLTGTTTVSLDYQPGIIEKLRQNAVLILLGLSVVLNLLLLFRPGIARDRLKALK